MTAERRWRLEDDAATLRRSIADAETEFAAGDLGGADRDRLVARDAARLAAVEAELAALPRTEDADGGAPLAGDAAPAGVAAGSEVVPRRRRTWQRNVGALLVVAALAVAIVGFSTNRGANQQITGGIGGNATQRLHDALLEAERAVAAGDTARALADFSAILVTDPTNTEALAEAGWLTYQSAVAGKDEGLVRTGLALVQRSVVLDPGQAAGHLYQAIIFRHLGRTRSQVLAELRAFQAGNPSSDLARLAAPVLAAYGLS